MKEYKVIITTHTKALIKASSKEKAHKKAIDLVEGNVEEGSEVDDYYDLLSSDDTTKHVVVWDID